MAELSPMMQQYLEIKKQHKDEILFYRIGDFYEMFFDDALTVSRELDLTLTGKQCGLEERAPMCGVPFHSYEGYVARLISKGYKVAICEQMEDPAKAKGLVKRDIIRVVTPGTVIESSMLQDDKNNYIASVFLKGGAAGLCFADVSTGTAHITELKREKIAPAVIAELCRYHPSEVLMNPGLLDCREITAYIKKNMDCAVELVEEERYAPGLVAISLENQFGRDWAAKTGIAEDGLVRLAMAALLEYLHDTQIKGVERLMTRAVYGSATPKEIYTMAQTCERLPELRAQAESCSCPELTSLAGHIDLLDDVKTAILAAIDPDAPSTLKDGGVIAKGYHPEVDELRSIRDNTKGVLAQLETRLRQETGIPKLKIGYNHVFGYYIEVSNSYKSMVPETYIRKQTLTSGERYITQELKELESKILGAHERLIALEHRLFSELLETIGGQLDRIQRTANAVAELDVLAALAQVAAENNYCRPVVDDSDELTITEGRHPVVEQMLKGSLFVPNDTKLNCTTDRCLIITGPNMAGKSTYMRQNALIALMAQIGSFVPASSCHVGVVDAIFTRIGASDDLAAGQSTFMVEMTEVAEILKNATPKSLVVLDEIGRGTSTFDGMTIARAVVEHISDPAKGLGCKTLFATHYHELTDLEGAIEGVKNYNIAVKKRGEDITFLRRIIRGPADDSYGIEVAKLAGLPGTVTRRAHEVLRTLEASAPKNKVEQMDFDALQEYSSPAVPSEMMEKLEALDVETLTPIEALNFLYELKKTLSGSLNG